MPPPRVADLFLFCYERDFTKEKRYDLLDAFNSTSRYLDDLLNNTLFFQSALGRQSAVETKSPNQGQSATTGVQSATEEGQTESWESQFDIA